AEPHVAEHGPRADLVAGAPAREAAVEGGDYGADPGEGAEGGVVHVVSVADAPVRAVRCMTAMIATKRVFRAIQTDE
ncbi:hypothetical protein, partial [Klebsiella pneumoniae]|uniref:hypothetical protein n=1 Tax=Klebsiella pneumoniae TaxID=573 RepID=UPI003F868028